MKAFVLTALIVWVAAGLYGWHVYYQRQHSSVPLPVWTPATSYRAYGSWQCPNGYHARDNDRIVWCETDDDENKRMENWERSLKPAGRP
jgi:hypothetical protein